MKLSKDIYKAIKDHCGDNTPQGIDHTTLKKLKDGTANLTLKTIERIFKKNNMPSSLTISHNKGGILTTTTINLWKE